MDGDAKRLKRMTDSHREILLKNRAELCESISLDGLIWDYMIQNSIIDPDQRDQIQVIVHSCLHFEFSRF